MTYDYLIKVFLCMKDIHSFMQTHIDVLRSKRGWENANGPALMITLLSVS